MTASYNCSCHMRFPLYRVSLRRTREIAAKYLWVHCTVSKAALGKLLRDGWSAYGLFLAHRYHLELY